MDRIQSVSDVVPLAIYPPGAWLEHGDMIKEAKGQLQTTVKLVPCEAVPGSSRVLAFREPPPFICEYALVRVPSVDSLRAALSAYMGLTRDPRWATFETWFREACGMEVTEREPEVIQAEVGFN